MVRFPVFNHRSGLLVLLAVLMACHGSKLDAQGRREHGGPRQAACAIEKPEDYAQAPEPKASDDDADSDDDDDDEEDKPEISPGLKSGHSGCVFINGSVVTGNQSTWIGGRGGKLLGRDAVRPVSGQLQMTMGLTHVDTSWAGGLVTDFSIGMNRTEATLEQAAIYTRYFGVGMMASRFDGWTGEDFTFRALASSQAPMLASVVPWRDDRSLVVLSVEAPTFRRVTFSGYGGQAMPDLVSRWNVTVDQVKASLSTAFHQTPLDVGGSLYGWAAQASARLNLPSIGDSSYVLAQGAYADKAPGFLGINTSTNAVGFRLPGAFNAAIAEASTGFSGALVGVWQLDPKWRVGSYITALKLQLPKTSGGNFVSSRAALNVTWIPREGLELALEAGLAAVNSTVPLVPSSRTKSLILTLTHTFP
jgi:hypothetical protein